MSIVKPKRILHSYVQTLKATPDVVWPLLCPVAEEKWIPNWHCDLVVSNSGLVEPECIFVSPEEGGRKSTWVVTKHDPKTYSLTMYRIMPEYTVERLDIDVTPNGDSESHAKVSFEYTSIGPAGDEFMEQCDEAWYLDFMTEWESQLNHYLVTGEMVSHE